MISGPNPDPGRIIALMNYLLVAMLGGCTGLRTVTPMAVLCWFAWRQTLHLSGWRSFTATFIAVVIFTLMALGEYVGDKLPSTPSRTAPVGMISRIVFAGFAALVIAQPLVLKTPLAVLAGVLGAIAGAYTGWFARTRIVAALRCPDMIVALLEDGITIGLSITFLHLIVVHSAMFAGNEGIYIR